MVVLASESQACLSYSVHPFYSYVKCMRLLRFRYIARSVEKLTGHPSQWDETTTKM